MNLVPGATPPVFQNAQTDTPGRALSTNVNGTNRNNNVTRIDGAASINVWLPHHAGYVAPAETIENVNISTNSFDAAQGMTGGAATTVQTKSGTNTFKGSAFFFRNQEELQRPPRVLRPDQPRLQRRRSWAARSAVPSAATSCSSSAAGSATTSATPLRPGLRCRPRRCGTATSARCSRNFPNFRIYDPATGDADRRGPDVLPERDDSGQPHQQHQPGRPGISTRRPTPPARTTASRTTRSSPGARRPSATTTTSRSTGTARRRTRSGASPR